MPKKGYIQSEEHILKRLTNKIPVNRILTCCACGNKFPREQIVTNNGFCDDCITHTKLCECGCDTVMFAYTKKGDVRQYLNQSHANKAINELIRSNMEDEEYANRLSEIRSEAALKKYQDNPELKNVRRQQLLERYEDPEEHKKTSEKSKEYWSDEYNREAQRQRQLEFIEKNPEITELRTQSAREYWNDEDAKENQRINANNYWDNKENRKRASNRWKGHLNPKWNNGSTVYLYDSNFNSEFKKYIRDRQNNICADSTLGGCNHAGFTLVVHHINRIKTETTSENCIALCHRHHTRAHNEEARIRHREFIRKLIEDDKTS